jgi:hypothetical protein
MLSVIIPEGSYLQPASTKLKVHSEVGFIKHGREARHEDIKTF